IERTPDIYLAELQEELEDARGIRVSCETIATALRHRGFTRKKVSREASERVEGQRLEFRAYMAENFRADQLVFVDESATN
ncbi:hypothetical protein L226DRAFT_443099, partial [Lentinus tigrinus ALCF2SS1-7]